MHTTLFARANQQATLWVKDMMTELGTGQTIAAGTPLFEVATDLGRLLLTTQVPEAQLARVRVGLHARFSVPAFPGRTFPAAIVSLGPLAAPTGARHVPLALEVDNSQRDQSAGMSEKVVIEGRGLRPALRVPVAALSFSPRGMKASPQEPVLWAAGDGAGLLRIPVALGASNGLFVEVRSPRLAAGAPVAVGYGTIAAGGAP
jgi:multidrug efflux pump subunit AcrA (membrane-fusion protein)